MTHRTKIIRDKRQKIIQKVSSLEINQSTVFGPEDYMPQILTLNSARELHGKRFKAHKLRALRSYQITRVV